MLKLMQGFVKMLRLLMPDGEMVKTSALPLNLLLDQDVVAVTMCTHVLLLQIPTKALP
jgi:hypothetical protein